MENEEESELIELFNKANSVEEKLQYFGKIKSEESKRELLNDIPEKERYKFIGKLKSSEDIAEALNNLSDEKTKSKTFNFIAKQFKGNNIGLLKILERIEFNVTLSPNMLLFKLNNINDLNLDFLINIQKHVTNYSEMRFKINEHESDSTKIEYSFSEISAIIAKVEELTTDIPKDLDEPNKFFKVYSRVVSMMTYDYKCITDSENARNRKYRDMMRIGFFKAMQQYDDEMREIREKTAGLYGGLVEGKAICAGYALILNEALKYVGIKSQYVVGYEQGKDGHAWNQVQIDGKWYNVDATWDSSTFQIWGKYENMLLNDEDFNRNHGRFSVLRTKTEHKCKSRFDYTKIQGLLPDQLDIQEGENMYYE